MKKFCITFLFAGIIILTALTFGVKEQSGTRAEFLRIHIRANSNQEQEQEVKYLVRDCVVEYLTPIIATVEDKQSALIVIEENLSSVECIATAVLRANGFFYTAKATLKKEEFPTRIYGEYTLPSGIYDSLIIELGKGAGENWWCVIYPPLCFANTPDLRYKSLIVEQIEKWRKRR